MNSRIKDDLIAVLDASKRQLHAASVIHFNGNISDPVYCELCRKANAIATLRRKIYIGEVEL